MTKQRITDFRKVNRYVAIRNRQYSVSEPFAHNQGFSLAELLVLIPLFFDEFGDESDGCRQREIVQRENLTKQTVNAIVKKFEKRGWVVQEPDLRDRRCKIIRLTPEGRRCTEPAIHGFVSRWNAAVGSLDDETYETLMSCMEQLACRIDEAFSDPSE